MIILMLPDCKIEGMFSKAYRNDASSDKKKKVYKISVEKAEIFGV